MNTKEAIEYLEKKRGIHTEDLSKVKYKVYDEDFSFFCESDKELIEYAEDQKANTSKEDEYDYEER